MKRFWWLIPTLAVLAGAFLLPGILLSAKETQMERRVFASSDVTPNWQGSGASLSMGEKLALMAQQDSAVEYDFGVVSDDGELHTRYEAELETLRDKSLISSLVYEWLHGYEYEFTKTVLLDMQQGKSLSLYRVQYYDGMTHVFLDAQSYKVLGITLNAYDTRVVDAEGNLLYIDYGDGSAPGWAEYYGAGEETDHATWLFLSDDDADYYLYAQRFTLDGEETGLTLYYSGIFETLVWRVQTPENIAWLINGESPYSAAEISR